MTNPSAASLTVEFTIEPFADDRPGPHVTEAIASAQALAGPNVTIDVGPFGTTISGPRDEVVSLLEPIHRTALEHGATRISVQSETSPR